MLRDLVPCHRCIRAVVMLTYPKSYGNLNVGGNTMAKRRKKGKCLKRGKHNRCLKRAKRGKRR